MDEVLAGKPVSVPSTKVAGCFIERIIQPKAEGTIPLPETFAHSPKELSGVSSAGADWPDAVADV